MKDKPAHKLWYYFGKCQPLPVQIPHGTLPRSPYKSFNTKKECQKYISQKKNKLDKEQKARKSVLVKEYLKSFKAIQFTGDKQEIDFLKGLFNNALSVWPVNDGKSLRINCIDYHYWVDIGDYIEIGDFRIYHHEKSKFERMCQQIVK